MLFILLWGELGPCLTDLGDLKLLYDKVGDENMFILLVLVEPFNFCGRLAIVESVPVVVVVDVVQLVAVVGVVVEEMGVCNVKSDEEEAVRDEDDKYVVDICFKNATEGGAGRCPWRLPPLLRSM